MLMRINGLCSSISGNPKKARHKVRKTKEVSQ
uniref:Uncharacterized protein n=1 Tax=Arundo donax TaxID=35708 RepID=A0A0A9T6D9_ARUDO